MDMLQKSQKAHISFQKRFIKLVESKGSFAIMGINDAEKGVLSRACQVVENFAEQMDKSFKIGMGNSCRVSQLTNV